MYSWVEQNLEKGFILKEEDLRSVERILKSRDQNCNMCYTAYLKNKTVGRVIVKPTLDELLEPTLEGDQIEKIEILCKPVIEIQPYVKLAFTRNGCSVEVKKGNHDSVTVVYQEINEFLHNHVYKVRFSWRKNIKNLMFLVSLLIGISVFIWFDLKSTPVHLGRTEVLRSEDVKEKLNYLVNEIHLSSNRVASFFLALTPFFLFALLVRNERFEHSIEGVFEHVFPQYVFLFGAEIEQQRKRESRRAFVLVPIVVASIVNLGTSLLVQLVFVN